jgi:hypothetical protein
MSTRVSIVDQRGSFRLVQCTPHGFAVIEARAGQVYSLDREERRQAEDCESGIAEVVGTTGWCGQRTARRRFDRLVRTGERLAEKIR